MNTKNFKKKENVCSYRNDVKKKKKKFENSSTSVLNV